MSRDAEHIEQALLFQWAELAKGQNPALELLYAIPNGGHRHIAVAKKLKAEGVKRGVPDICLPVPMGGYHGLYIELKAGKNKPSDVQKTWMDRLAHMGHRAVWCVGWEAARDEILWYLGRTR